MATRWVVKPRWVGRGEGAMGTSQFASGWGDGNQVVVAADSEAEALAIGERMLKMKADDLEVALVTYE